MKRFIIVTILVLAVVLLSASEALAGRPVHQLVGGGHIPDFLFAEMTVVLSARIDADGVATGQIEYHRGEGYIVLHGVVDCLSVQGNEAWVSGIVTQSNGTIPANLGLQFIFRIRDNGQGANVVDEWSGMWLTSPGWSACSAQGAFGLYPWDNGNFAVR
jgi:hypothetical protein